ncbi:MAG: sugar ABC transporter ATP-binding protein [Rhizobiaceae bacterium]
MAIRKAYGPTVALDDASFTVKAGTVHALLGENGAGKSTLVKVLSGLVQPDAGSLTVHGESVSFNNPRDAHLRGIQTAFQEMTQIPDLSVTQNMLLLYEPTNGFGQIRGREGERIVERHLAEMGLANINPRSEIRDLDLAIRQKLEIARAVFRRPRVLLLDEPTSTLSGPDIAWLGDIIAKTKAEGVSTIFISHRMPEVHAFCEYLTVLRNGKDIGTARVGELSDDEVVRMIVGRSLSATFPARDTTPDQAAPPALEARSVSVGGRLSDASFKLARGEVLGVAGLQGMGQRELFLACFGAEVIVSGEILVGGNPVTLTSPRDAIRANIGISLVPEDRKTEGLFLKLDGRRNVSLPTIDRFTKWGVIDAARERDAVSGVLETVQVDQRALYSRAGSFSGGNQQKIALAKWLLSGSNTLLLYDPTRGVDVGTKHEIYVLIRDFVREGGSVLLFSTEIPELVNLCDRVIVMYAGKVAKTIDAEDLSEDSIIHATLGGSMQTETTKT